MLVAKFEVTGNFPDSAPEVKYVLDWVKFLGDELAKACYTTVPVKTGNLRDSVKLVPKSRGFELIYLAPYAYSVHEGTARDPSFSGNYKAKTRRHQRKLPTGKTVSVREHTKVYKTGYKPVATASRLWTPKQTVQWSAVDVTRTRTSTPWIQIAWSRILAKVDALGRSVLPVELVIESYQGG